MREKQPLSFFNISENLQESQQKKLYFWHILELKSKLQIIHATIYIALFLPDSNKCFFICSVPHIHICFYYFLILCSYFHLLFLTLFATRHILQFTKFDSISEIKKTPHSPRRKKKYRVHYNQNKYSNMIIVGTTMSFSSLFIKLLNFSFWSG